MKSILTVRSSIDSQNVIAGNPSALKARFAATISASGVENEVAVCFLDSAATGNDVLGPSTLMKTPDVDLV